MKAKHKREWLQMKQNWWSKLPASVQKATTKPGSVKHDDYLNYCFSMSYIIKSLYRHTTR